MLTGNCDHVSVISSLLGKAGTGPNWVGGHAAWHVSAASCMRDSLYDALQWRWPRCGGSGVLMALLSELRTGVPSGRGSSRTWESPKCSGLVCTAVCLEARGLSLLGLVKRLAGRSEFVVPLNSASAACSRFSRSRAVACHLSHSDSNDSQRFSKTLIFGGSTTCLVPLKSRAIPSILTSRASCAPSQVDRNVEPSCVMPWSGLFDSSIPKPTAKRPTWLRPAYDASRLVGEHSRVGLCCSLSRPSGQRGTPAGAGASRTTTGKRKRNVVCGDSACPPLPSERIARGEASACTNSWSNSLAFPPPRGGEPPGERL
mmetsp:Transcript_56370/g.104287  ORF Transcript_56370/g.104287 Transcript_56370/m.104287 type:complete len:315 (+) Transcript_56370:431-1375(+)